MGGDSSYKIITRSRGKSIYTMKLSQVALKMIVFQNDCDLFHFSFRLATHLYAVIILIMSPNLSVFFQIDCLMTGLESCNKPVLYISTVAEHLTAQRSAIKMLVSRVRAVLATVRAIRDGALPPRPALLREARALSNRLPLLTSQQFRTHFYNVSMLINPQGQVSHNRKSILNTPGVRFNLTTAMLTNLLHKVYQKDLLKCNVFFQQCNDVALMTYLGTITKGCNAINQLVNRFNVLYDRQGMGRRMRGLFFQGGR